MWAEHKEGKHGIQGNVLEISKEIKEDFTKEIEKQQTGRLKVSIVKYIKAKGIYNLKKREIDQLYEIQ